MKTINREAINRMIESQGVSTSGGNSSSPESLSGYATQLWVNANYISIEFFSRLFTALDANGDPIVPNDMESVIDSIQSMFGFWTELYISALGQGSGGGAAITLGMLEDVQLTTPQNGQVLKYNGTAWVNASDSGGIDMQTVWNNLAASGVQQIDSSHLSTALSGYATQTWVGNQGYITSSALTGYATQTWVGQNYLGINATAAAATKLETARTLWGQSFDGTANVTGDMSSVGDIALGNGKRIYNAAQGSGGSLYIGRSDDGGWVYISDMCSRQGTTYWNIPSSGSATFANVLSNGYVAALSDIRKKDVTGEVELDVDAIALARLIRFTWKDKHDQQSHVGGIAQEWQKILPESVQEAADGTLSMDYGVIGMISAVTLARKVQEQERRLDALEAKIKRLEKIL